MDKLLTVNQKKASKQPKNKKKPVKVVYITNPIKFKTSASEFRSLVQELTGQDADMPEYSPRFVEDNDVGDRTEVADAVKVVEDHAPSEVVPTVVGQLHPNYGEISRRSDPGFGIFDDFLYPPQIVDNFQELVPSNQWHETTHFDGLKS
ncbi:Hypothetical predicted protein [Olea europaea subsp. europaea]|uniref:VQ domain-containing protein n=1 Tax=Olea europaea subsp. europaea TaxID=158383 RepID=A0A8S0V789_OLEEU|nr:Hypothetical predicted protein [Olea europaea subsp. europaea]